MYENPRKDVVGSYISDESAGGNSTNSPYPEARFEDVKANLSSLARAKAILGGGVIGTDVVESPLIVNMIEAYRQTTRGKVIVTCVPEDSGKTHAAEYFMRGNHPYKPDRALKISAAGMKDFASEFVNGVLGIEQQASHVLVQLLCGALTSKDVAIDGDLSASDNKCSVEEAPTISITGPNSYSSSDEGFEGFPVLIIDNFNKETDENIAFVEKLLQQASEEGVFVFLLTSNTDWATRLVGLSGGSKIKPLYENVDNSDYDGITRFRGVPEWNEMPWPAETLRELIRSICDNPSDIIPDVCDLNPVEAMDKAWAKVRESKGKVGTSNNVKENPAFGSESYEILDKESDTNGKSDRRVKTGGIVRKRVLAVENSLIMSEINITEDSDMCELNVTADWKDPDEIESAPENPEEEEETSITYEDKSIILTGDQLTLKKYFKPEGRPKIIPRESIKRVWLGTDPTIGLNYFKKSSWGNAPISNGIWWTMAICRESNDDRTNFVVCNAERERHGFTVENPKLVKSLLATYIQ